MQQVTALVLAAVVVVVVGGCAQQDMLTAGVPLRSDALGSPVRSPDVAGWRGGIAEVGVPPGLSGSETGRKSRAARVLAAIALQRVTGRSIDPGTLAHDE